MCMLILLNNWSVVSHVTNWYANMLKVLSITVLLAKSIGEKPDSIAAKHLASIIAQYAPSNENNNLSADTSPSNEVCMIISFSNGIGLFIQFAIYLYTM